MPLLDILRLILSLIRGVPVGIIFPEFQVPSLEIIPRVLPQRRCWFGGSAEAVDFSDVLQRHCYVLQRLCYVLQRHCYVLLYILICKGTHICLDSRPTNAVRLFSPKTLTPRKNALRKQSGT